MNVYDIIAEKKDLDEAPVGALKQIGRRVGAKAAGMVGMKQTAGNLSGKADTGAEANQLRKGFSNFLGRMMKSPKEANAQDLAKYLSQNGYPVTSLKGMSGVLTKKQIDQITLKAVADKAAGDDVPGVGGAAAPQSGPQSGGQAAPAKKQGALKSFAQGFKQGSSGDATTAAPGGTANAAPADKSVKISPELQKKINSLNPQQKKQLVGML